MSGRGKLPTLTECVLSIVPFYPGSMANRKSRIFQGWQVPIWTYTYGPVLRPPTPPPNGIPLPPRAPAPQSTGPRPQEPPHPLRGSTPDRCAASGSLRASWILICPFPATRSFFFCQLSSNVRTTAVPSKLPFTSTPTTTKPNASKP